VDKPNLLFPRSFIMKNAVFTISTPLLAFLGAMGVGDGIAAEESFAVSQAPLLSGLQMDPNVIYLHDDSSSMLAEHMPDGLPGGSAVRHGKDTSMPASGVYDRTVFLNRSAVNNKQHYNPDITYQPPYQWKNGKLVSMGNADTRYGFPKVPTHLDGGFSTSTATRTLSSTDGEPHYFDYVPGFNSRRDNPNYSTGAFYVVDGKLQIPANAPEKSENNYEYWAFRPVAAGRWFRANRGSSSYGIRDSAKNEKIVQQRACPILFRDVVDSREYYGHPHGHCRDNYRMADVDVPSMVGGWGATKPQGVLPPGVPPPYNARPWCLQFSRWAPYDPKPSNRPYDFAVDPPGVSSCFAGRHLIGDTDGDGRWTSADKDDAYVSHYTHDPKDPLGGYDQSMEHRVSKFVNDDGDIYLEVPRRRTRKEEIRNFANWYAYYRTRAMAAQSGASLAFANLVDKNDTRRPSNMMKGKFVRLGYDTINLPSAGPGQEYNAKGQGVAPFRDFPANDPNYPDQKFVKRFYDWLLNMKYPGGTPLPEALNKVGKYLQTKTPWKEYPPAAYVAQGDGGSGKVYGCRRSFAIMMTDGYYGGWAPPPADYDVDAKQGPVIWKTDRNNVPLTGKPKNRYQYEPKPPFFGENVGLGYGTWHASASLADVAMYYWNRDLLPDVPNMVATTRKNPAFWQHMQTYTIGLGVLGRLSDTEVNKALADPEHSKTILWTFPTHIDTNYEKVDDLMHAGLNGHGGTAAAEDAGEFAGKLGQLLTEIAGEANTNTSLALSRDKPKKGKIDGMALAYRANYDPADWSGSLEAYGLCTEADVEGAVDGCEEVGKIRGTPTAHATLGTPSARNILTALPKSEGAGYVGATFLATTVGLPERILDDNAVFQNKPVQPACPVPLDATKQCRITKSRDVEGKKQAKPYAKERYSAELLIDYVRGDHSHEDSLENVNVADGFRVRGSRLGDIVHSDPLYVSGTQDYGYGNSALTRTQREAYQARQSANQAAFNAARNTTPPKPWKRETLYVGANDGMLHGFNARTLNENFAYVPASVHANLKTLADPDYSHLYYVDGVSNAQDAWLGDAWKTIVLGSTGAGGRSYFALNVEDPEKMGEDEVLWEFTDDEMGVALGMAEAGFGCARDASGGASAGNCAAGKDTWFAAFGNGVNSKSDEARLFVVDLRNGAKIADLVVPGNVKANGLSTPLLVDVDGDLVVDLIYAGDLQGNLWKFNVSDPDKAKWSVNKLLVATDKDGKPQPITTRPSVALARQLDLGEDGAGNAIACSTANCVMVSVGTGKLFEANDVVNDMTDMSVQSLYVVRDECGKFCSDNTVANRGNLEAKTLELVTTTLAATGETLEGRGFSGASSKRTDFEKYKGYVVDLGLLAPGERVIASPGRMPTRASRGHFLYSSFMPSNDPCSGGGEGWAIALSLDGSPAQNVLFTNGAVSGKIGIGAAITATDANPRSTVRLSDNAKNPDEDPCGALSIATASGGIVIPSECVDKRGRQSWRQLR
jgi:type IV pilus assembly protein PilY1